MLPVFFFNNLAFFCQNPAQLHYPDAQKLNYVSACKHAAILSKL